VYQASPLYTNFIILDGIRQHMARETDQSRMAALPTTGLVCSLIAGVIGFTQLFGLLGGIVSLGSAVGLLGIRYKHPRSIWRSFRVIADIIIVGVLIVFVKIREKLSQFVIQRN